MKKNYKYYLLFLVLFILLSLYIYFFSGFFTVNKITVLGQTNLTKQRIIKQANIDTSKNIYLISLKEIENNLKKDNYIESAIIKRKFPREITISISERIPVASIPVTGGYVIIDENAVAINIVQDEKKVKKPIINGININNVKLKEVIPIKTNEELENVLKLIRQVSSLNLLDNISFIDLKKLDDISMTTKSGIIVKLGNMSNIEYKSKLLNKILIDLSTKGKSSGTLDMRFDSDPIFY